MIENIIGLVVFVGVVGFIIYKKKPEVFQKIKDKIVG